MTESVPPNRKTFAMPSPRDLKSVGERLVLSLIVGVVCYGIFLTTIAQVPACLGPEKQEFVFFHESPGWIGVCIRLNPFRSFELPIPELVYVFFNAGPVFDAYGELNYDYGLWGLPEGQPEGSDWQELNFTNDVCEHSCPGQLASRFETSWNDLLGQEEHDKAMALLARKIRALWNRKHPDGPMSKVAIYEATWPRSDDGYYINRNPNTENWRLMYREP